MLDVDALRLDVSAIVRDARRVETRRVRWMGREVIFDEEAEELRFEEDDFELELTRVPVRVPTTGHMSRGPVLALCPRRCGARARVLWTSTAGEFFPVCRSCAGVEYATARGTELERAELAYKRLRQRFGLSEKHASHEPRPCQHRTTYRREAERLEKARSRLVEARKRSWR